MRQLHPIFVYVAGMAALGALMAADAPTSQPVSKKTVTASGLTIIDMGQDDSYGGAVAKEGDAVWVDYTGKLTDGTKFDAYADHLDVPVVFVIGHQKVIKGWEEGIVGMKVGQKRQLIIPPSLAYGDSGAGPIPPNSTLVFDVQLLGLKKAQ